MMDRIQLPETEAETPLHTSDLVKSNELTSIGEEHVTPVDEDKSGSTPLFVTTEADSYRSRWEKIQTGFVDEPRQSVERADELVAAVIKRLAEVSPTSEAGLNATGRRMRVFQQKIFE
jgi:hypothetical protein